MAKYNVYSAAGYKVEKVELFDPNSRNDIYYTLRPLGFIDHTNSIYGDSNGWFIENPDATDVLFEVKPW